MIAWILYCILDIIFNLIAYLTNPIVVLFADEVGELPKIFTWWANWDDGLDVDWMVYEHHVPSWAEYDFNRHYKYHSEWDALKEKGIFHGYVDLLDPNFTLKERFQRYICRLVWIYRNCAYGFSYYVTGRDIDGDQVEYVINIDKPGNRQVFFRYKHWLTYEPFVYYVMYKWNPKNVSWLAWTKIDHWFYLKLFFGWKFQSIKPGKKDRAMLALFAWPFK